MADNFILQEFFPDWFQVSSKEEIVILQNENSITEHQMYLAQEHKRANAKTQSLNSLRSSYYVLSMRPQHLSKQQNLNMAQHYICKLQSYVSLYSRSFPQITLNESVECFEEEPINNTYLQKKVSMTENTLDQVQGARLNSKIVTCSVYTITGKFPYLPTYPSGASHFVNFENPFPIKSLWKPP